MKVSSPSVTVDVDDDTRECADGGMDFRGEEEGDAHVDIVRRSLGVLVRE